MIKYLKEQCTIDGELHRALFILALCFFVFSPTVSFFSIIIKAEANVIQACIEALISLGIILICRIPLFGIIKSEVDSVSNGFLLFSCIISILFTYY